MQRIMTTKPNTETTCILISTCANIHPESFASRAEELSELLIKAYGQLGYKIVTSNHPSPMDAVVSLLEGAKRGAIERMMRLWELDWAKLKFVIGIIDWKRLVGLTNGIPWKGFEIMNDRMMSMMSEFELKEIQGKYTKMRRTLMDHLLEPVDHIEFMKRYRELPKEMTEDEVYDEEQRLADEGVEKEERSEDVMQYMFESNVFTPLNLYLQRYEMNMHNIGTVVKCVKIVGSEGLSEKVLTEMGDYLTEHCLYDPRHDGLAISEVSVLIETLFEVKGTAVYPYIQSALTELFSYDEHLDLDKFDFYDDDYCWHYTGYILEITLNLLMYAPEFALNFREKIVALVSRLWMHHKTYLDYKSYETCDELDVEATEVIHCMAQSGVREWAVEAARFLDQLPISNNMPETDEEMNEEEEEEMEPLDYIAMISKRRRREIQNEARILRNWCTDEEETEDAAYIAKETEDAAYIAKVKAYETITSVSYILKHNGEDAIGKDTYDTILKQLVGWLPITGDAATAVALYGLLSDLIERNYPVVLGVDNSNVPKLISAMSKALNSNVFNRNQKFAAIKGRLTAIIESLRTAKLHGDQTELNKGGSLIMKTDYNKAPHATISDSGLKTAIGEEATPKPTGFATKTRTVGDASKLCSRPPTNLGSLFLFGIGSAIQGGGKTRAVRDGRKTVPMDKMVPASLGEKIKEGGAGPKGASSSSN